MIKKIQLLMLFAKPVWLVTLTISTTMWGLMNFNTEKVFMYLLGYFLFIKIATNFLIYGLYHISKTEKYLFYQNLGFSKSQLWVATFILDCLFFILIFNLVSALK